jgi:RNA 3'-terminal phosphate cyclase
MNIIETKNSVGPGNIVFVEVVSSGLTEVFSGFGKIGKSADSVASDASESARSYLASGAAVGENSCPPNLKRNKRMKAFASRCGRANEEFAIQS